MIGGNTAHQMPNRGGRIVDTSGRTLLAKIWDQHVIAHVSDDTDLLHVDRHLLHDLGGSSGLINLKSRNIPVHNPELTFATPDHAISTASGRAGTIKTGWELLAALRTETSASGIRLFDLDQPGQGIVHVIGPELGLSLPAATATPAPMAGLARSPSASAPASSRMCWRPRPSSSAGRKPCG
jgi:3-isopropylmalate/(R)-2-methylmalate dehydratase large subunit